MRGGTSIEAVPEDHIEITPGGEYTVIVKRCVNASGVEYISASIRERGVLDPSISFSITNALARALVQGIVAVIQ